jgi:signal transduction histidine kinase
MPAVRVRYLLSVIGLAAVYVAGGRFGLELDAIGGFASLVWPSTGISLAVLLIGGIRLWPGVAIGAFLVNLWVGLTLQDATLGAAAPLALGIAFGNTLEAVAAAYAIGLIPDFDPSLTRLRDALGVIVLGAVLSTVLSATIGASSLLIGGFIGANEFGLTWGAWWMGDAIADLTLAPLLLTWSTFQRTRVPRRRLGEAVALGVLLIGSVALVFLSPTPTKYSGFLQPYLLSPFLIWASVRFLQHGATAATFMVSAIAVWGTTLRLGPFTDGALYERLGALQAFLALMAVTFLMLGAVAAERRAAERALRVAKDSAEEASRAKSRFLALVSHELRTPLNGVLGYADLLLGDVGGSLTERQTAYVTRVRAAAWHLVSIIDSILTFSKGDAKRLDVELESVDATALVRDAVDLLTPYITAKPLQINYLMPEAPVIVHTDPVKVRQIMVNLVGNAVKFTTGAEVDIELVRDDRWVTFRVTDSGPGIAADELERIFEPFTQLDGTEGRRPSGTGLGLPVSRMLAELLGGDVTVTSRVPHGSTFTLILPSTTPAAKFARV